MNFAFPAGYESDPSGDEEDMGRWEKKANGGKVTERPAEVSFLLRTCSEAGSANTSLVTSVASPKR